MRTFFCRYENGKYIFYLPNRESAGEGCEIILPATSKGTHILVLNVGGRVVKKKVFIK